MRARTALSVSTGSAVLVLLALAGCGREADRAARPEAFAAQPSGLQTTLADYRSPRRTAYATADDSRAEPAPAFEDGKPVWAANRRHSGEDNARWQFGKNGKALEAASIDAYVAKAHAFIDTPPKGVLTARRANGDRLLYDPKSNLFAVADKDGAPRTLFKPRDGMSYWTQQTQKLAEDGSRRSDRGGSSRGDDAGSGG